MIETVTAVPTRNVSVCEPQDLDRPDPEEELVIPNSAELIEMYAWNVIFGMVSGLRLVSGFRDDGGDRA